MREWAAGLRSAVTFLTVLPVGRLRPASESGTKAAPAWFPLVGVVVGVPVSLALLVPMPDPVRAALGLVVWVAITGGLHEDGWADCCDAAFAPVSRERRLEILRDPRIGAHGMTGSILLQLLRYSALLVVSPWAPIAAAIVGRTTMAWTLARLPSPRSEGLAARYGTATRPVGATVLALLLLTALSALSGWRLVVGAVVVAIPTAVLSARFLTRRFGGLNGDGHGAVGLATETAALIGSLTPAVAVSVLPLGPTG